MTAPPAPVFPPCPVHEHGEAYGEPVCRCPAPERMSEEEFERLREELHAIAPDGEDGDPVLVLAWTAYAEARRARESEQSLRLDLDSFIKINREKDAEIAALKESEAALDTASRIQATLILSKNLDIAAMDAKIAALKAENRALREYGVGGLYDAMRDATARAEKAEAEVAALKKINETQRKHLMENLDAEVTAREKAEAEVDRLRKALEAIIEEMGDLPAREDSSVHRCVRIAREALEGK